MRVARPLLIFLFASCSAPADWIFHGGVVHTLVEGQEPVSALVVRGDSIAFVGGDADALSMAGPRTWVVDLAGRALLPGFHDAHMHLMGYGESLRTLNLLGTRSWDEVVSRTVAWGEGLEEGEWLVGNGWDQNDWDEKRLPTHHALSEAFPRNPVLLWRVDGHAALANQAALDSAGLIAGVEDPAGGRILREEGGFLSGVLLDRATGLVTSKIPPPSKDELRLRLQAAVASLHRRGVTAVGDAGVDAAGVDFFRSAAIDGEVQLRLSIMLDGRDEQALNAWLPGGPRPDLDGHGLLSLRSVKVIADGALGSRGAALREDYADDPGNRGLVLTPSVELEVLARRCREAGFQLCAHAIGDRACGLVLDAFEVALEGEKQDLRFRLEHAQLLTRVEVARMARMGIVASMQAQHATSDMPWVESRVGALRAEGAYAWRWLMDAGVPIAGGTDAPVEDPDPIASFWSAVTRTDSEGNPPGGWFPEHRMTRMEALHHLIRLPAWASFQEGRMGTLEKGKVADLVVLSGDPLTLPESSLPSMKVDMTLFNGSLVHPVQGATSGSERPGIILADHD